MLLHNTLSRTKELFTSLNEKNVTIYVCGITPYDTTHLGHAFTYIAFDVLFRYLRHQEYEVIYTQNVTDINDRDNDLLKRAQEQKIPWQELASFWTKRFLDDMQTLNWIKPTNYIKASENIESMIKLIQKIIDNNAGYVVNNNVYLNVKKDKTYGELSRLTEIEMLALAKQFEEDVSNPDKKNQLDITLWRASSKDQPAHIPSFPSPFGDGRPGWHIECSAMAINTLGEQIDIHGGGQDLIYPHHESEIVQSQSASLKIPFAKYWLHTGTVSYIGKKMSKSLGNLVLVSDLLKKYSPNTIRWMLLSHHYRESWEFHMKELDVADALLKKITPHLLSYDVKGGASEKNPYKDLFLDAMDDDLNTPQVLTYFAQWADEVDEKVGNDAALQSDAIGDCLKTLGFSLNQKDNQA